MILRAGLCCCCAMILGWLFGIPVARADGPSARGGPAAEPGVRLPRRNSPDLSLFVRRAPDPAAGWITRPGGPRASRGPPVCVADVCQPQVAVPGMAPSSRGGSRTDAVLAMLSGSPLGPVSRVARALSNVRLDYAPSAGATGERGWGRVVLSLRWRIDATGAPAN